MSNFLHWLAHKWDHYTAPCVCRTKAYVDGWRARRDAELAGLTLPTSPDEMDVWLRKVIADSEAGQAA